MFRSWYFAARYIGARFFGGGVSTAPVNPTVTIRPLIRCTPTIRPSLSVTPTITQ